jgi:uracil phosphoribosyltransferase
MPVTVVDHPLAQHYLTNLRDRNTSPAEFRALVDAIVDLLPEVSIGYFGLERDERTAIAATYYKKLPSIINRAVFLIDPMLATGGSARSALKSIYAAAGVTLISIVAAPEGVALLESAFPDLQIFTAALDRELNERKFILPGLGDFGDRLYGTF